MDFSAGLVVKVLGGLGVAGLGATGIYFLNDHLQNPITRFDKALIDYLNTDGYDIVFSVTGTTDNTFPTFTDSANPVKVTAKVTVNASTSSDTFKGDKKDEKVGELKKLNKNTDGNNGKDWTWECVIEFDKTGKSSTALAEKVKKLLVDNTTTPKGFFDQLKEDTTTENQQDKSKIKKIKEGFIRNCALARTKTKNKEIDKKETLGENDLKATKTFKLMDGVADDKHERTETGKLYFEDQQDFDKWFKVN